MEYAIQAIVSVVSVNQADAIVERIDGTNEFTMVPSADPRTINKLGLALLRIETDRFPGDPPCVTHVGVLRKGQRVATHQCRIKVTDIIRLSSPISWSAITAELPATRANLENAPFQEYTAVPPATGMALVQIIVRLCRDQKDALKGLFDRLNRPVVRSRRAGDMALEKDATGLCLDIFGIDRSQILRRWNATEGMEGKSFLNGLSEHVVYEDDVIQHDLHNFPGFSKIGKHISGVVEFRNEVDERLVIINANRKPLERAMGVDLIYYHRKYAAFTFVQYKIMEELTSSRAAYYNPKQPSHDKELKRMCELFGRLQTETKGKELKDYRIMECPVFFKLCRRIELAVENTGIAPGAYIALDHWQRLIVDASVAGPKGGIQLSFDTLDRRYMGTQVFVELVQKGFVGSCTTASEKVALFVEAAIENGKSVLVAMDESERPRNRIY